MNRYGCVMLLLLGCVEPVRVARDGGEDVPDCAAQPGTDACDDFSSDNVMFTWARSVCGFLLQCCASADREGLLAETLGETTLEALALKEPALLDEPLACRRAVAGALLTRFRDSYRALDDGRRRYDRASAVECLSWFDRGSSSCVPGFMTLGTHEPKACGRLFRPAVELDAGCRVDDDCRVADDGSKVTCASSSRSLDDGGFVWALDGTCQRVPGAGAFCPLPWSTCASGHFCSLSNRCELRSTLDEPCVATQCDETTYCEPALMPARCALRKTSGEPCRADIECRSALSCHPTLNVCLESAASFHPLDVEFSFCLGPNDYRVARRLEGVPADGGL